MTALASFGRIARCIARPSARPLSVQSAKTRKAPPRTQFSGSGAGASATGSSAASAFSAAAGGGRRGRSTVAPAVERARERACEQPGVGESFPARTLSCANAWNAAASAACCEEAAEGGDVAMSSLVPSLS